MASLPTSPREIPWSPENPEIACVRRTAPHGLGSQQTPLGEAENICAPDNHVVQDPDVYKSQGLL